jgi:hypothetical protein
MWLSLEPEERNKILGIIGNTKRLDAYKMKNLADDINARLEVGLNLQGDTNSINILNGNLTTQFDSLKLKNTYDNLDMKNNMNKNFGELLTKIGTEFSLQNGVLDGNFALFNQNLTDNINGNNKLLVDALNAGFGDINRSNTQNHDLTKSLIDRLTSNTAEFDTTPESFGAGGAEEPKNPIDELFEDVKEKNQAEMTSSNT